MSLQDLLDRPAPIRQGEALELEKLGSYLRTQLPNLDASPIEVLQFPSGHSNLTYLLKIGERELVLRRPPFGAKIKTAHDMQREFHILSHLVQVYPKVPRPLIYCEDTEILGAPFYLMDRLKGVILRGIQPQNLQ